MLMIVLYYYRHN